MRSYECDNCGRRVVTAADAMGGAESPPPADEEADPRGVAPSERQRAVERRLRNLRRESERFEALAESLGHDLRSPLTVAEGRLELARTEGGEEHLAAVARAHERLERFVDALVDLARTGVIAEEVERVSLGEVARRCWSDIDADGATLAVETDATVVADRAGLAKLLENLFRNAAEHGSPGPDAPARDSPHDPTVTIGTMPHGDGFFVEDDGPGIPAAARGRLFEAGFSTTDRRPGFGLRIVEDVATAHGWTVEATESATGGARFEVGDVDRFLSHPISDK